MKKDDYGKCGCQEEDFNACLSEIEKIKPEQIKVIQ